MFCLMKMGTQEKICELCLNICDDFKAAEGDMINIWDVVLPKMNLTTVMQLMMCTNCTVILMKCFHFKATCFYAHDYLVQLTNGKNDVKVDLKYVYLMRNKNNASVLGNQDICGFCMDPIKNCSAMSLDVEEGALTLKEMIERCLPELNFSIIKKPVICPTCHHSLEKCYHFVTNYLIAEEKIKKTLNTTRIVTVNEIDGHSVDLVKVQEQFCEERENDNQKKIDNDGDIFKLEEVSCEEGDMVELEDQAFLINEEIEIKTEEKDLDSFQEPLQQHELTHDDIYKGKHKDCLLEHKLTHPSELTLIQGDQSSYQARFKDFVERRMDEVVKFKCELCPFNAVSRRGLNQHKLSHRSSSELTMLTCKVCSFEAMGINYLKRHQLCHEWPANIEIFKCKLCPFEAKYRVRLERHKLTHKSASSATNDHMKQSVKIILNDMYID